MPEQPRTDAPKPKRHAPPDGRDDCEIERTDNPQDGPYQERRKLGTVEPEQAAKGDPRADETADQLGIEIDNALERPRDGEHGRRSE